MDCVLHLHPSMAPDESRSLRQAFELAGIRVAAGAPLAVHAIEPFSVSPTRPVAEAGQRTLRVRRFGARRPGLIDWAAEISVDLAAWMLASPPPPGSFLDVVVPAAAAFPTPRLGKGLIDTRHVSIEARDGGVPATDPAALRSWAIAAVEAMRSRWSAGAACPCC